MTDPNEDSDGIDWAEVARIDREMQDDERQYMGMVGPVPDDRPGIDVTGDGDPADIKADERDEHGFGRHNIDHIRERTASIQTGHQPFGEGPAKPVEDDEDEEPED